MATSPSGSDQNALLVQLCVKVLKNASPDGMTTKELAAELDKEVVPGFDGISSSILSSKLNAVFRRSHNDSPTPSKEQLAELPLTRGQSSEIPRRLVYRYAPPSSADERPVAEVSNRKRSRSDSEKIRTPTLSTPNSPSPSIDDDLSGSEGLNEPLTPKEDYVKEGGSWSPATKRRRASLQHSSQPPLPGTKTANRRLSHPSSDTTEPSHRPHTPPNPSPPRKSAVLPRSANHFNLYYDAVGVDNLSAALAPIASYYEEPKAENPQPLTVSVGTESDSETWADLASPESLCLSELDKLVC